MVTVATCGARIKRPRFLYHLGAAYGVMDDEGLVTISNSDSARLVGTSSRFPFCS